MTGATGGTSESRRCPSAGSGQDRASRLPTRITVPRPSTIAKLQVADRAEAIIRDRRVGLGVAPDEAG